MGIGEAGHHVSVSIKTIGHIDDCLAYILENDYNSFLECYDEDGELEYALENAVTADDVPWTEESKSHIYYAAYMAYEEIK
jgi:hypothetical protein